MEMFTTTARSSDMLLDVETNTLLKEEKRGVVEKCSKWCSRAGNWFSDKIPAIVVQMLPVPIYYLLVGLFLQDKCLNSADPIPMFFLLGLAGTFELIHMLLFSPPKRIPGSDNENLETIKFSRPEDLELNENGHKIGFVYLHIILCAISICSVVSSVPFYAHPDFFSADSVGFVAWVTLGGAALVEFILVVVYKNKRWMNNFSKPTMLFSIGFLTMANLCFILSFLSWNHSSVLLLLGSFSLLVAALQFRFAFVVRYPPHRYCMVTIKPYRKSLHTYYTWTMLLVFSLWSGLLSLSLFSINGDSCNVGFKFTVLAVSTLFPSIFLGKILYRCYASIAKCLRN